MQSILGNTRKADIVFCSSGRIDITSGVAKQLQMQRGDVIDIMIGKGEFYLYVKCRAPLNGRHGAMVYPTNSRGKHFRGSSKKLSCAILKECGATKIAKLCVGEPIESPIGLLIPIITKHLLPND